MTGAFLTVDRDMRLETGVLRVETTEFVTTVEVRGEQEPRLDLQEPWADQVIDGLQLVLTEEERHRLRAQQEANRIDDRETMLAFSDALCLLDHGAYVQGFEAMQGGQRPAPGSQVVNAVLGIMKNRAEDSAGQRLRQEGNNRIGGLPGRRNSAPAQPQRPVECGGGQPGKELAIAQRWPIGTPISAE